MNVSQAVASAHPLVVAAEMLGAHGVNFLRELVERRDRMMREAVGLAGDSKHRRQLRESIAVYEQHIKTLHTYGYRVE